MPTLFQIKAPTLVGNLMNDLSIDDEDASAIVGNLGHESGGFKSLQEIKPTVKGSLGGYGWAQWTGPRRTSFMTWCKANNLAPSSDQANYGYLLTELKGAYKASVAAVKKAVGIEAKTKAFEASFERAGVKHYPERIAYAKQALGLYHAKATPVPSPEAKPEETADVEPVTPAGPTKDIIEKAQQRLRDLGFPEVGNPDGLMGDRTAAAIRAAQGYYNLPVTGAFDDATLTLIMDVRTPLRDMGARSDVTAKDLGEKAPVTFGNRLKTWGTAVMTAFGLGGAADGTINFDDISAKLTSFKGFAQVALSFSPWILGAVAGAAGIYAGVKIVEDFVNRWRTGRAV